MESSEGGLLGPGPSEPGGMGTALQTMLKQATYSESFPAGRIGLLELLERPRRLSPNRDETID